MQKLPSTAENLKTIIILSAALLAASLIFRVYWLAQAALAMLVIGTFSEYLTSRIAWIWLKFAEGIGKFNSKVILSLAFFLVLVPLAFVRKLFTRDLLDLKRGTGDTLYHTRNHEYTAADLENPW